MGLVTSRFVGMAQLEDAEDVSSDVAGTDVGAEAPLSSVPAFPPSGISQTRIATICNERPPTDKVEYRMTPAALIWKSDLQSRREKGIRRCLNWRVRNADASMRRPRATIGNKL